MRWTGKTPMEMERVHLLQDGFEVTFTLPAAEDAAPEIALKQYDYDWWWEYGSPERATTEIPITETSWSADRKTLTLRTAGLTPAMMARCKISGVRAAVTGQRAGQRTREGTRHTLQSLRAHHVKT